MGSNVEEDDVYMKNNRILLLMMVMVLTLAMAVGCSKPAEEPVQAPAETETPAEAPAEEPAEEAAMYEDGTYFAMEDEFNAKTGWKSAVIIEVKDGKIADINWTAASNKGGLDKKEASKAGFYPMVEVGKAQAHWHEQAQKVEAYLLETQDATAIKYSDDEGHTDAISGVSVHVNDFFMLAEKALAAGPAQRGMYKDGAYTAEEAEFHNGWKYNVSATVLNGQIVAVNWNASNEEDAELNKKTASMEGNYPMVENGGAIAPWHEQAAKVEAHLLATQDPTDINFTDEDGHTDAIAGATIKVNAFFTLAEEALKDAK